MDGEWLLRIEDIDAPREKAGAGDAIIRTLESFGFQWDGAISYQSQRSEHYLEALESLSEKGLLYPCACSRKEISKASKLGIYPGTCRDGLPDGRPARSWRVLMSSGAIAFNDAVQGPCHFDNDREIGDFILKRADGLFAYQLAVAVDDTLQGITQVVRGSDLLDSTPRQIYLQQVLGHPHPEYAHHPVVIDEHGAKLSKQQRAPALNATSDKQQILTDLYQALGLLGQMPPKDLLNTDPDSLWQWAFKNWSLAKIPAQNAIRTEEFAHTSDIEG